MNMTERQPSKRSPLSDESPLMVLAKENTDRLISLAEEIEKANFRNSFQFIAVMASAFAVVPGVVWLIDNSAKSLQLLLSFVFAIVALITLVTYHAAARPIVRSKLNSLRGLIHVTEVVVRRLSAQLEHEISDADIGLVADIRLGEAKAALEYARSVAYGKDSISAFFYPRKLDP